MSFNDSRSHHDFVPPQALAPTPALYDALVGDTMENLARASLGRLPALSSGAVVHDNGCGTGAGTAAVVEFAERSAATITVEATDVDDDALARYRDNIASRGWPATARHMDSRNLGFADSTFTHSLGNAFLFVLPDDGVDAIREAHRCLRPGGVLVVNSWHYVPNIEPVRIAARRTRPAGTPLPREGLQKWSDPGFLHDVVVRGGFDHGRVTLTEAEVACTTGELIEYATLLWSFVGGTAETGWLTSDVEQWDEAIHVVVEELRQTPGFRSSSDGGASLTFVANVAVATK